MVYLESTYKVLLEKHLNGDVNEYWINWATDMLVAGYETELLVELAGISKPYNQFELKDLTDKLFKELNLNYSDRNSVFNEYLSYKLRRTLDDPTKLDETLSHLKDLCIELDYEAKLYDFYQLYFAKDDLKHFEHQNYWDGATRNNIEQICVDYFQNWLFQNETKAKSIRLYGISGLGADKRVFSKLNLEYEIIPIEWITPLQGESIESYSERLSNQIDTSIPYGIIGVSFGGVVATEISKILKPSITILISSPEVRKDLRFIYRFIGHIGILNYLPVSVFNMPKKFAQFLFGSKNKELLNEILEDTDPKFVKWAINSLTKWENNVKIKNCFQISGNKDKLIPPAKHKNIKTIDQGEHFMIVDRADELSKIINKLICP